MFSKHASKNIERLIIKSLKHKGIDILVCCSYIALYITLHGRFIGQKKGMGSVHDKQSYVGRDAPYRYIALIAQLM